MGKLHAKRSLKVNTGTAILGRQSKLADGSMRAICGQGDFLLRLFKGVFGRADLSPSHASQLDLIRQSVHAQEPGGGRLVELLQCFLHAQADARGSVGPVGS
jgi:hypothetical protein